MKILNISPLIPYPLSEGGKISQFAITDSLRKLHEITLVFSVYSEIELNNIQLLKNIWPEVDIEIIDFYSNINIKSKKNIIKSKVFFLKRFIIGIGNYLKKTDKSNTNNSNYVYTDTTYTKSRLFIEELNKIINKKKYDLIQVEFYEFIDLVYTLPSDVKKIFIHHEISFVKEETSQPTKGVDIYEKYILNLVKSLEINALRQYDSILVFSDIDKNKLAAEIGIEGKVYNSPFPVLNENFISIDPQPTDIDKLIFLGGESHYPNKDAVIWYINEIAPLIIKSFDIKLHIIGNWDKKTIKMFSRNNSVIFTGYVDDIISYSKNSIMVVPVRIGSGIRTKILYAMAQGVPVISASVGCEGILVRDQNSIVIADTAIDFANSIKKMLIDKKFRHKIASNAQLIAKKYYSQSSASKLRNEIYHKVLVI